MGGGGVARRLLLADSVHISSRFGQGGGAMAKIIEFYIPKDFRSKAKKPLDKPGELIEFHVPRKSA
jgi:hypothetical protein